jgi:tripartite-type tricarboxylate transporter receptor subunit TctC
MVCIVLRENDVNLNVFQCFAASFSIVAAACVPTPSLAQNWPEKPVRFIIPFGPGGGTDIQARLLSKKFYESTGQTLVVENRAGAGGLLGAEFVARAPADGYTVLFASASIAVNVTLYKKIVTFDAVKDLAPICWTSSLPNVLVVHPSVPAKSLQEFVALVKKSSRLNAGHNGAGTTSHLAVEMFKQYTGSNMTSVPYKGGGPAVTALISGEVDFAFGVVLAVLPHVKSGKINALAVTTREPAAALPGLPTMNSMFPGFEADNWYGIFMPTGTPKPIIDKFNAILVKTMNSADVREFMAREGAQPVGSTPEQLAAMFAREITKYAKVIETAKITTE